ncbi:MAG: hypothetical protein GWP16_03340 [Nitrospirae bacterium]|nr:hypothetical protein [Nitrospirota bacterium]
MNDQDTPQEQAPQEKTETPTPPPASDSAESANRGVMIILSYLWILALIPLLLEKDDKEVQWHAKNGLLLTMVEVILQLLFNAIAVTGIGCVFAIFIPFIFIGFTIIRVLAIVKGLNGQRLVIPGLSQYVDKF